MGEDTDIAYIGETMTVWTMVIATATANSSDRMFVVMLNAVGSGGGIAMAQ